MSNKIELKKTAFGTVYTPKIGEKRPGAMYPRVICLAHNGKDNGTLLATFERYTYDTPVFTIFKSTDNGLNWTEFSNVEDTKNGWGMRYQPQLFEVPQQVADLEEGTILCAGSSIPDDMSITELQLYKSTDKGETWSYMSSIVKGGKAHTDHNDGERPVWEPYLYLDKNGDLVCYYSDERFMGDGYNQLLSHQVSKDGGLTWGEEVFDVAFPDGVLRPGMPIVVKLPNDKYIMVYEIVGLPDPPIYCRFSDDGLDWGDPAERGTLIETEDGDFLTSTPYCIWTKAGGENGTLIVSAKRPGDCRGFVEPGFFLVNYNLGEGKWEKLEALTGYDSSYHFTAYSQTMVTMEDDTKLLQLTPIQINTRLAQIGYAVAEIKETE